MLFLGKSLLYQHASKRTQPKLLRKKFISCAFSSYSNWKPIFSTLFGSYLSTVMYSIASIGSTAASFSLSLGSSSLKGSLVYLRGGAAMLLSFWRRGRPLHLCLFLSFGSLGAQLHNNLERHPDYLPFLPLHCRSRISFLSTTEQAQFGSLMGPAFPGRRCKHNGCLLGQKFVSVPYI